MTQAEGNHGGNTRQSQANQNSESSPKRWFERPEEGSKPRTGATKDISGSTGTGGGSSTMTRAVSAARRQSQGSSNQEMKSPEVVKMNPSEWPALTKGKAQLMHAIGASALI